MKVVSPARKEERVKVLQNSVARVAERLARNDPADADKRAALQARLDEYKQSLENLEKFHAEIV